MSRKIIQNGYISSHYGPENPASISPSGTGAVPRNTTIRHVASGGSLAQRQTAGMRDRAHTVSGPSPRRLGPASNTSGNNAAGGPSSGGSSGASSRHPSSAGGIRRGPDFLRSDSSADPAKKASHVQERVTGISPQFVFLQLYQSAFFGGGGADKHDRPILLPHTMETSIKNLDRIHA